MVWAWRNSTQSNLASLICSPAIQSLWNKLSLPVLVYFKFNFLHFIDSENSKIVLNEVFIEILNHFSSYFTIFGNIGSFFKSNFSNEISNLLWLPVANWWKFFFLQSHEMRNARFNFYNICELFDWFAFNWLLFIEVYRVYRILIW